MLGTRIDPPQKQLAATEVFFRICPGDGPARMAKMNTRSNAENQALGSDPSGAILEILDRCHVLSLATKRHDGWPQVTMVNYLHIGLDIYFVIARDSQKFRNIDDDDRVSIAVGQMDDKGGVIGLSMAARAQEITQPHRIAELNKAITHRAAEAGFTPHPSSQQVAVMKAEPEIITLIDYARPPGRRRHFRVVEDWRLEPIEERPGENPPT